MLLYTKRILYEVNMVKNLAVVNEDDDEDFEDETEELNTLDALAPAEKLGEDVSENEGDETETDSAALKAGENNMVISSIDDISPLEEEAFYNTVLENLFQAAEGSDDSKWLEGYLKKQFGQEKDMEALLGELTKPENQEEILNLLDTYLVEKTDSFKDRAFSLNADVLNSNYSDFKKFIGFELDGSNISNDIEYKLLSRRVSKIKPLGETLDVLFSGVNMFNMIASNSTSIPTQIEVENMVQQVEDFYINNILNQEQVAMGYHNAAIVFERLSAKKNGARMQENAVDYMRKALSLTSNPRLIKTCYEYLPDRTHNKMLLVREACDRVLGKPDNEPSVLFRMHSLYSKALLETEGTVHFAKENPEVFEEAIYHYRQAFVFAGTQERKAKILRNIANLQKNFDYDGYVETRAELAEQFLEGKTKVRELLALAGGVENTKMKTFFLESAVNELIDTPSLKKEERSLLLRHVFGKLRKVYGEDAEKLQNLEQLERKYCKKAPRKDMLFARVSSKGNDYFN